MKNKKGYYFSIDALIALIIILGVVLFIKAPSIQTTFESNVQGDILEVLSNLKIGEIDNSYAETLRNTPGKIKNLDKSVLEQIGEFYADSDDDGRDLAQAILDDLELKENIAIYFDNEIIASTSSKPYSEANSVSTARQLISGIRNETASTGFSARAFLFAENKVDYFYFGGYVGDGNITAKIVGNVIGVKIEGVFGGDFSLYVNGNYLRDYTPTANEPYEIIFSEADLSNFVVGENDIEFKAENNIYIAGGFIRVSYDSSSTPTNQKVNYLPGIDGLINLYDSFYIPGELKRINASLHFNSSYDIFFNVGNTTIYSGNSSGGETTVTITNSSFASNFNFDSLSHETIPFRLGLENVSYIVNLTRDADVFSVTDLSGSMDDDLVCIGGDFDCCEECAWIFCWDACGKDPDRCLSCGGTPEGKIISAIEANKVFINAVLNSTNENRVGLVGYSSEAYTSNYHALSDDNESLITEVDSWTASGGTCICCGINYAVDRLVAESDESKSRSIVVMSDGEATVKCDQQGTGSATQDAIQAACDAYNNYSIIVHAIGFGTDYDEDTLSDIADCGHGDEHFGNVEDIIEIYKEVAQDVISAAYSEQTVVAEGVHTKLYPDSYISFDYAKDFTPGSMVVTAETPEFGVGAPIGILTLPGNSIPYEVRVVSYSDSKWTSKVEVNNSLTGNWQTIFNLEDYNNTYTNLGDPYVVNIPISQLVEGDNFINVSIGLSSANYTPGSDNNKIIYSVIKNISSFTPVVPSAEGCNWTIQFEDDSEMTISVPSNYSGDDLCYYNTSTGESNDYSYFNSQDAIEYAIALLLQDLDLNSNGKIETKLNENDLTLSSNEIGGIPFTWDTEIQARVWF